MKFKDYIINKGYFNQLKRKIEFVNDFNLIYNFETFRNNNIKDMEHLTYCACKKWLKEHNKHHYMVVRVKFTNRGTTLYNYWHYN